jgi:hypothetical protein
LIGKEGFEVEGVLLMEKFENKLNNEGRDVELDKVDNGVDE